jgi:tetratricopeptide (TPR) repeat protein
MTDGGNGAGTAGRRRGPAPGSDARRRARALAEVGRHEQAVRELAAHLASEPGDGAAWCLLAQCHYHLGDHDTALAATGNALACDAGLEHAWRLRAMALKQTGRHHESVDAANEAVRLEPGAWAPHVVYAQAAMALPAGLPHAYAAAVHAVGLEPNEPTTHFQVGAVAQAWGRWEIAEAAYRRVLALDPDHAMARNNLGVLKLRGRVAGGGDVAAAEDFVGALAADPQSGWARRNIEVLAVKLLGRARWPALGGLLLALFWWRVNEAGDGSAAGRALSRGGGLLLLALLWTGAGLWARFRLPPRVRGPLLALARRSPRLRVLLAALATAVLLAATVVAQPWPSGDAGSLAALVLPAGLVLNVVWVTASTFRRRRGTGRG